MVHNYYLSGEERFGPITSRLYTNISRFGTMRRFYEFVVDDIIEAKPKRIMDIGTGPGIVPIMLGTKLKNAEIVGVDPSTHMLKIARKKARREGLKISFRQGSSRSLMVKGKFDIVFASISFHHWADKEKSIEYLLGFVKKGGELRIYEFAVSKGLLSAMLNHHSVRKEEVLGMHIRGGKISSVKAVGKMVRFSFRRDGANA